MITVKETQGDTLIGAIDGVNTLYQTTYDFVNELHINIFVNGRLKIRDWDDGFTVVLPNKVILKEPLLVGDSLEVEYQSGMPTGGGADGGCPPTPEIVILAPDTVTEQNVAKIMTEALGPYIFSDVMDTGMSVEELKPVIIMSREG